MKLSTRQLLILVGIAIVGFRLGIVASGAALGGWFTYYLYQFRKACQETPEPTGFMRRVSRLTKLSLFAPVLSLTLALVVVSIISIFIVPMRLDGPIEEHELARQISAGEQSILRLTESLQNWISVRALFVTTAILLGANLVWPNLPLVAQLPRLRAIGAGVLVFFGTLSAFTLVSTSSVALNSQQTIARFRAEIQSEQTELARLQAETASFRAMKYTVVALSTNEIQKLGAMAKALTSASEAVEVARQIGKEAVSAQAPKSRPAIKPVDLDSVKDLGQLQRMHVESLEGSKRMRIIHQATREALLGSLDELTGRMAGEILKGAEKLTSVMVQAFVSGAVESVALESWKLIDGNPIPDDELAKLLSQTPDDLPRNRMGSWLNKLPPANSPELIAAAMAPQIRKLDADAVKLKRANAVRAANAAKAAAKAEDGAKAAKKVLRLIF